MPCNCISTRWLQGRNYLIRKYGENLAENALRGAQDRLFRSDPWYKKLESLVWHKGWRARIGFMLVNVFRSYSAFKEQEVDLAERLIRTGEVTALVQNPGSSASYQPLNWHQIQLMEKPEFYTA